MPSKNILKKLQNWYKENCNGDWEHQYGIQIGTVDNPGWSIEIDLRNTRLENKNLATVDVDISENDWFSCFKKEYVFNAVGDPDKLEFLIDKFIKWAEEE